MPADQQGQTIIRKAAGLYSQQNPLNAVPEGALSRALNAVIDREGVIGVRRGVEQYGVALPGIGEDFVNFKQRLLVRIGSKVYYDGDGAGGSWVLWSDGATTDLFAPPTAKRTASVQANGNLYLTTSAGVMKNDSLTGTPVLAGMPQALDIGLTRIATTDVGWLPPGNQVGYRIVWGREDANRNEILGAPSFREVLTNPSAVTCNLTYAAGIVTVTKTGHGYTVGEYVTISDASDADFGAGAYVIASTPTADTFTYVPPGTPPANGTAKIGLSIDLSVEFTIPDGVRVGDFFVIYRTYQSESASVDPGMRFYKVAKKKVTLGDLAAGTITFTDTFTDGSLDTSLYTNDTAEGEGMANDRPPYAEHVAAFEGHVFYGNIRWEHEVELRLLDVSLTAGISSVTIETDGTFHTYQAKATENIAAHEFRLYAGSILTLASDIANTMRSLVRVINRDPDDPPFYAYYTSGVDEPPGKIVIRRKDYVREPLYLTCDDAAVTGAHFDPALPNTGQSVASKNEEHPNYVATSKYQRPEAVPFYSMTEFGSMDKPIVSMRATKDSVLIEKTDGVYYISGKSDGVGGDTFTADVLDPTVIVKGSSTAVVLDNSVFSHTTQGAVRAVTGGSSIVSRQIEPDLKRLAGLALFDTLAHACAYESDRKYLLATPEESDDTTCTVIWVYNYLTGAWTKWDLAVSAMIVLEDVDDKLYLADATTARVLQERKTFRTDDWDFQDPSSTATVTVVGTAAEINGATVRTITVTAASAPAAGSYVEQGTVGGRVVSVALVGELTWLLTLDTLPSLILGAITIFAPIPLGITYLPEDAGNASMSKQFTMAQFFMENNRARAHRIGFRANTTGSTEYVDEIRFPRVSRDPTKFGWGKFPWGKRPWSVSYDDTIVPGDASMPPGTIIPRDQQRCETLQVSYDHTMARERVAILQLALDVRVVSTRTIRRTA